MAHIHLLPAIYLGAEVSSHLALYRPLIDGEDL
jgi:hypothetical protein